jgi:hypothetical protein
MDKVQENNFTDYYWKDIVHSSDNGEKWEYNGQNISYL